MSNHSSDFHSKVGTYYDEDALLSFEKRSNQNELLQTIRNDFRRITQKYPVLNALELGCGPGFDVCWMAKEYPKAQVIGIDISAEMVKIAHKNIEALKLSNAIAKVANEKTMNSLFEPESFDMITVYFGALNTVESLNETALNLHKLLRENGIAVLTFVNKWYLREMLVQFLKGRFKTAFARLRKDWGGYSLNRHLQSRCYSPNDIHQAFSIFTCLEREGYSIFFPAWYNYNKYKNKDAKLRRLWKLDKFIQNTFLWSKGEYTLFVFQKK